MNPSDALREALEILERSQYLFAHGVGAMTDNGDKDNQERNVREGGELMRGISAFLINTRAALATPVSEPDNSAMWLSDTIGREDAAVSVADVIEGEVERVALAIERADRQKAPEYDDLGIDHPEISDWGIHLARAAIAALRSQVVGS